MTVYDHSGDIVFRILTQSFLCSANNDEEVPLQTHSQANGFHEFELFLGKAQYITTTINAAQGQQKKIKLVHLDLGNYHVIFRFRLPIAYHGRASSLGLTLFDQG
uniref:Uncharacterized protein n=1 Tax=Brassica campestris TaxID=3711 RepID=M4EYJ3_BRACM